MYSFITSLSPVTNTSPTSSDFFTRLKSILSSTTSSQNFSTESAPPSFSEWKRKVRYVNDLDYISTSKLELPRSTDSFRKEIDRLKDSNRESSNQPGDRSSCFESRYPLVDFMTSSLSTDSRNAFFSTQSSNLEAKTSSVPSTCSHLLYCQPSLSSKSLLNSSPTSAISTQAFQKSQASGITTSSKKSIFSQNLNKTVDDLNSSNKPHNKKSTSVHRKNIWKNQTYADLICKAILSSPTKRLTLSQIYEWLIENIEYFKAKKEGKCSVGWKNSIRHNLSLHSRFVRIQGHESGKSSWWTVDLTAKSSRRCKRKTLLTDPSKEIHRLPCKTTSTFFRYQTPYEGYPTNGQFQSQNPFYQQGREAWLSGFNAHKTNISIASQNMSMNDKFSSCYFPCSDAYSYCCKSSLLPTSFANATVDTCLYTPGVNSLSCNNYYNRSINDGKATTNSRYFPNNLNQYDDYFYFKNSTGFQFPDSASNLPVIGVLNDSSRAEGVGYNKTLPSLFSSFCNNFDNDRETRNHGNLNYISATNYDNSIAPSRYYYRNQQANFSEDRNFISNYKKHSSSGYLDDVKVNHAESNLGVT